ncbi:MAG: hypothetical protein AUH89_01405 [Ktedonobacter sp. 13_1_40CM_4_52_4]|nr:MAG: hypothetical protein AUH89_01405 [Ktedonobacter sp. 13_1_40CM_4_52_4]
MAQGNTIGIFLACFMQHFGLLLVEHQVIPLAFVVEYPFPTVERLNATNHFACYRLIDFSGYGPVHNLFALHFGDKGEDHTRELAHRGIVDHLFDAVEGNAVVLHFFQKDGDVRLRPAQAVKRADNDTLYLSIPIPLTHRPEFLTLVVLVAGKGFTVHHADSEAILAAELAPDCLLFVEARIILLGISGNATINIYDGWVSRGLL